MEVISEQINSSIDSEHLEQYITILRELKKIIIKTLT